MYTGTGNSEGHSRDHRKTLICDYLVWQKSTGEDGGCQLTGETGDEVGVVGWRVRSE